MRDLSGIRIVTLCSSLRFLDQTSELAEELRGLGLHGVYAPTVDLGAPVTEDEIIARMTLHLGYVSLAELVYVVDPGGYMGPSVFIEIGRAYRDGKYVVCSERPAEVAAMAVVSEIIPIGEIAARLRP